MCVDGVGVGGGFTRGDPPQSTTADGFYSRFSAGGGYGTKSVVGQVLGEAAYVGSRLVGGVAVELAVIPRPEEVVSPSTDGKGHGGRSGVERRACQRRSPASRHGLSRGR